MTILINRVDVLYAILDSAEEFHKSEGGNLKDLLTLIFSRIHAIDAYQPLATGDTISEAYQRARFAERRNKLNDEKE